MKLLLDTHIWLWCLLTPEQLRPDVVDALSSAENELYLSPISIWEALILAEKGRLKLGMDGDAWIDEALHAAPMLEAPLTRAIARESRRLVLPNQDPADRFIIATAKVRGLTLVTADRHLLASGAVAFLPN